MVAPPPSPRAPSANANGAIADAHIVPGVNTCPSVAKSLQIAYEKVDLVSRRNASMHSSPSKGATSPIKNTACRVGLRVYSRHRSYEDMHVTFDH